MDCKGAIVLENMIEENTTINADTGLIQELFYVLIENSIIYRDVQKPNRFLRVTSERNGSANLDIHFMDNGIGVSPDLGERIFEMFVVGTTTPQGPGLGLYEAKVISKN